jgi:hypothetical protein
MMFGLNPTAPASAAAPAPKPGATAMFGAVQPVAAPKANNATMMFGQPPDAAPVEPVKKTAAFAPPMASPPTAPVPRATVIFGAPEPKPPPKVTAGGGGPMAKITESTVRVDLDALMREREARLSSESGEASADRHNRTQLFAMNDAHGGEKTPPEAFAALPVAGDAAREATPAASLPGERRERTQLFSMSGSGKPEGILPAARHVAEGGEVTLPHDAALRKTMVFGGPQDSDTTPGVPGLTPQMLKAATSSSTSATGPNVSPIGARDIRESPLERQFEKTDTSLLMRSSDSSQDLAPSSDDSGDRNEQAFAAIESATRRRNTIAVIVLLVAVFAAGSALVWLFFIRPAMAPEMQKLTKPAAAAVEKAPKAE